MRNKCWKDVPVVRMTLVGERSHDREHRATERCVYAVACDRAERAATNWHVELLVRVCRKSNAFVGGVPLEMRWR